MADESKNALPKRAGAMYDALAAAFREREDVLVASNLSWFPVEGQPEVHSTLDVCLVFGRPRGDRESYHQWKEMGTPVTVAFEFPTSQTSLMDSLAIYSFCKEYGVEEFYHFDPEQDHYVAFTRKRNQLRRVESANFVSPRLGEYLNLAPPLSAEDRLRDETRRRIVDAERRIAGLTQQSTRLAELSRKVRRGESSSDELRELVALEKQFAPPGS